MDQESKFIQETLAAVRQCANKNQEHFNLKTLIMRKADAEFHLHLKELKMKKMSFIQNS
jgi:hypothetical protein